MARQIVAGVIRKTNGCYSDRARIESYLAKLNKLVDGLINAETLADFDNFQAALDDYAYTGYKI